MTILFTDVVRDNNQNPIPGAFVTVRDYPSGNLSAIYDSTSTLIPNSIIQADVSGAYSFSVLPGLYTLEFRLLSYETARKVWLTNIQADPLAGNQFVSASSSGFGYVAGQGGSVTQLTSKTTAVTLNKPCGQIVTSNAALAGGATAEFVLNNNCIGVNDLVIVNVAFATNAHGVAQYRVRCGNQGYGAGQVAIELENVTGGSLSDAVTVLFAVLKSVIA